MLELIVADGKAEVNEEPLDLLDRLRPYYLRHQAALMEAEKQDLEDVALQVFDVLPTSTIRRRIIWREDLGHYVLSLDGWVWKLYKPNVGKPGLMLWIRPVSEVHDWSLQVYTPADAYEAITHYYGSHREAM